MRLEYAFSYLPCQSCTAKNHCEQCQAEIAASLLRIEGVVAADVNVPQRLMILQSDGADPDEIDDEMDAIGVFIS